jgi:hypothetical protein
MRSARSDQIFRTIAYFLFGFGYAVGTGVLSFFFGGAGHGWASASTCWVGVFVIPVLGVALSFESRSVRRKILWPVSVLMLAADLLVLFATREEGWGYSIAAFRSLPLFSLLWLTAWFGWQALALKALFRAYR